VGCDSYYAPTRDSLCQWMLTTRMAYSLVGGARLELATNGLKVEVCSCFTYERARPQSLIHVHARRIPYVFERAPFVGIKTFAEFSGDGCFAAKRTNEASPGSLQSGHSLTSRLGLDGVKRNGRSRLNEIHLARPYKMIVVAPG
jgi:hypothetical protein